MLDRDPAQCELRIKKRRELLQQLYEENQFELAHPALIEDLDRPIEKECTEIMCLLKNKDLEPKERKRQILIKILGVSLSIATIIALTLLAILIGRLGN